jgi:hypothetical protein
MRWASVGTALLVVSGIVVTCAGWVLVGYALAFHAAAGALLGAAVALLAVASMVAGFVLLRWASKRVEEAHRSKR